MGDELHIESGLSGDDPAGKVSSGKSASRLRGAQAVKAAKVAAAPDVYRRVGKEVLSGNLDPECWARALVGSKGGHDEALAQYARLRTEELAAQVGSEEIKKERLNCRVARAYQARIEGLPLEPLVLGRTGGLVGALDAIFWHCVAIVGTVSCLLAAQIVWPELRAHLSVERVVLIVLAFQLIPILGWLAAGRNGFYAALRYSQTAHLSACVMVVGSLAFGGYLLLGARTPEVVFAPDRAPGSLLVVLPEEQRVQPVVHVEGVPTQPVRLASSGEGK